MYIIAFVLFALGACFRVYHHYREIPISNLLVAPLIIWLFICWGLTSYLPGASYFILPLYALLGSLLISLQEEKSNLYFLVFLAFPAIWIYTPFIQMFPVGLGLKMLAASTVLTTLTFFLLLPVFDVYKHKKRIASLSFLLFLGFMVAAHINSGNNSENPKPTSLLYVLNTDKNKAQWATYENELSSWTSQYLGENKTIPEGLATISSKYDTYFTYVADDPIKELK